MVFVRYYLSSSRYCDIVFGTLLSNIYIYISVPGEESGLVITRLRSQLSESAIALDLDTKEKFPSHPPIIDEFCSKEGLLSKIRPALGLFCPAACRPGGLLSIGLGGFGLLSCYLFLSCSSRCMRRRANLDQVAA